MNCHDLVKNLSISSGKILAESLERIMHCFGTISWQGLSMNLGKIWKGLVTILTRYLSRSYQKVLSSLDKILVKFLSLSHTIYLHTLGKFLSESLELSLGKSLSSRVVRNLFLLKRTWHECMWNTVQDNECGIKIQTQRPAWKWRQKKMHDWTKELKNASYPIKYFSHYLLLGGSFSTLSNLTSLHFWLAFWMNFFSSHSHPKRLSIYPMVKIHISMSQYST